MLGSFLSKVFLLHIPYWIRFCLFSSSFFFFIWGVSYTSHWIYFSVGSFSYTSRAGFFFSFFLFIWGVSLTHPVLNLPFCGEFTHPLQTSFLCGEFLLYIPICLHFYPERFSYRSCVSFFFLSFIFLFIFYLGSFSYTSHAGFIFIGGVSLTHPVLASFLSGEFLLHIPCWLRFYFIFIFIFYLGSFSYTSHVGFTFLWGVSLTHPELASFFSSFSGEFLFHIVLGSFLLGEFLLHIPCWLHFYIGSFLYTSRAGFFFLNLWSFSYTSHTGFTFLW